MVDIIGSSRGQALWPSGGPVRQSWLSTGITPIIPMPRIGETRRPFCKNNWQRVRLRRAVICGRRLPLTPRDRMGADPLFSDLLKEPAFIIKVSKFTGFRRALVSSLLLHFCRLIPKVPPTLRVSREENSSSDAG